MTRVVHCMEEPYDYLIDRTTIYGNPYSHKEGTLALYKTATRKESIEKYRDHVYKNPELLIAIQSLRDKTIGCWCKSRLNPKPCHGDIIVEILDRKVLLEEL